MNDPASHPASRGIGPFVVRAILLSAMLVGALQTGRWLRSEQRQWADRPETAGGNGSHQRLGEGALLYTTYCAKCHGPDGHGDPESLERLKPPPRDFAGSSWRFERSAAAIRQVVRDGIPGTAMGASGKLFTERQLDALADYVLELAAHQASPGGPSPALTDRWKAAGFERLHTPAAAPALALETCDGESSSLAEFQGEVVILNFWGTACVSCLKEMPHLVELGDELSPAGLAVVSVCADETDPGIIAETAARIAPGHPVYLDRSGLGVSRYEAQTLPTFWILDRRGRAVARRSGAVDWTSPAVRDIIREVLQ